MDKNLKNAFDIDPETGAYVPKPPTKIELEKMKKSKEMFKKSFIEIFQQNIKEFNKTFNRVTYPLRHPISYIKFKKEQFKLGGMLQDKELLDSLFQENVDELNLRSVDDGL